MLGEEEKRNAFHSWKGVLSVGIMNNASLKTYISSVFTLEKPKNEIEMIRAVYSNERHFYAEEKDSHYIVLKKDFRDARLKRRDKYGEMDHLNDSNVNIVSICHNREDANKLILTETVNYARGLGNYLDINEFCDTSGKCSSLEDFLTLFEKEFKIK